MKVAPIAGSDLNVSVLMPVHNSAKTVKLAVTSTLAALPRASELLVMLDNCSDETDELLTAVTDSRMKIYRSTTQLGVAKALNLLLEDASGEFVARMDADDICLPWRFRSQIRSLAKSSADITFSNAVLFGRTIWPFGLLPQPPVAIPSQLTALALLVSNPFVHPTMFAKRSALSDLGGYASSAAEDYELWVRASLGGKILTRSRGYTLLYRVHKKQLTQQQAWKDRLAQDFRLHESQTLLANRVLGTAAGPVTSGEIRRLAMAKLSNAREFSLFTRLAVVGLKYMSKRK